MTTIVRENEFGKMVARQRDTYVNYTVYKADGTYFGSSTDFWKASDQLSLLEFIERNKTANTKR